MAGFKDYPVGLRDSVNMQSGHSGGNNYDAQDPFSQSQDGISIQLSVNSPHFMHASMLHRVPVMGTAFCSQEFPIPTINNHQFHGYHVMPTEDMQHTHSVNHETHIQTASIPDNNNTEDIVLTGGQAKRRRPNMQKQAMNEGDANGNESDTQFEEDTTQNLVSASRRSRCKKSKTVTDELVAGFTRMLEFRREAHAELMEMEKEKIKLLKTISQGLAKILEKLCANSSQ